MRASTSVHRPASDPAATGFMPTVDLADAVKARNSAQAISVFPTPVSVPVTKKPWPTDAEN
jgi:hypothetical protein